MQKKIARVPIKVRVQPSPPPRKSVCCGHALGKPNAHPDPLVLDYTSRDQVEWSTKENKRFVIRFTDGSPFSEEVFIVPSQGHVGSGPIVEVHQPGELHKYFYVLEDKEGRLVDPEIDVQY